MTSPVEIQLVLDASAAVEFAQPKSVHVGEVLTLVQDDDAVALLPLACLVEAYQWAQEPARLDILANHPAVVILAGEPGEWKALATMQGLVGRQDAAAAALAAIDAGVQLMTRQPNLYHHVGQDDMVLAIED